MRALTDLGLRYRVPVDPEDFANAQIRSGWIRDKGMRVFSFFMPDEALLSVDLFVDHPIEFEGLYARSETCDIGFCLVRIASIPDLIHLKRLADRPRDRGDIVHLEKILQRQINPDGA